MEKKPSIPNFYFGNDTIDGYPLKEREIKKILVVSEQKFKELQKDFQSFFKGVNDRLTSRSSLLEANKRQIFRPKLPHQTFVPEFDQTESTGHFRGYEPTNAIYCNNSDWRRWVRVKEWFSQYAQGAE